MSGLVQTIKHQYEHYERHISSATLLFGFVLDNFTLRRIDQLFDVLVLTSYVLLSGACIIALGVIDRSRERGHSYENIHFAVLLLLQFAFGGIFSAFFIFYTRSGAISSSWPFFLVLGALLIGNEIFKKRYSILVFRVSIYFFILFSYAVLYVPVLLKEISSDIFLLSGLASLALMWGFLHTLRYLLPRAIYQTRRNMMISIGGIFVLLNVFYFTNIIPPIPLAMKEAGVFHSLINEGGEYIIAEEPRQWYSFLRPTVYHATAGESAYAGTAIFAPTDLKTNVVHEWQYFDESQDRWITVSRITFPIVGGRDGGYRGYSMKSNIAVGRWRVNVENERGQVMGRLKFRVEPVLEAAPLETKKFI